MEQLRDSRDAILATMHQPAIVLNHRLRVETANRSFLETFQVSEEETLHRRIFNLADGQWNFPEVHRLLQFMLRDTDGRLADIPLEHDFERIGYRAFHISACHLNDDTARLILVALNEVEPEAKYRNVFLTANDGIVIMDAESAKITDANQSLADLLGLSRERLIGLRFWEIEPLIGTPLGREGFERVRTEGVVRFPVVSLRTKNRRVVEMEVIGSLVGGADNQTAQFNFRDITERRRSDRQLQTEANRESLRVLAGGIAHDFNNLLTVIMGYADLALGTTPQGNPSREYLGAVLTASHSAARLTDQMLAYSGRSTFVFRRVDLSQITQEAGLIVKSSLPEFVALEFDLAADPLFIDADPTQITQLIVNLAINGAEAVAEGQMGWVRITTRHATIEEEYIRFKIPDKERSRRRFVVVEVADSGSGMDAATLARIFEPFFTTRFVGRGLGLAAASGIVKGHGGAILVESKPEEGTTFQVFLPSSALPH